MKKFTVKLLASGVAFAVSPLAFSGTDIFFTPLTESAPVATVLADENGKKASSDAEINQPWVTPAGISQSNLTSMSEIEADITQSVVRVAGVGSLASMWDMIAFDPTGKFLFIPHETPMGAGLSRYDIENDKAEVLFQGNGLGVRGTTSDWSADWGSFDPATFTPNNTVLLGEEWSGQGRIIEVLNPMAAPSEIQIRELNSIPNVSHEGLRFSADGKTLYFVDEWNSGSLYKIVFSDPSDYSQGSEVFVLKVRKFKGDASANWDAEMNEGATRTGLARWVKLANRRGNATTEVNPFKNGISDTCNNPETFGGRCAADEVNATPFGRPEDMEIGRLANGREVIYFTATSERRVYSVEVLGKRFAKVRVFASDLATPKNAGFPATTAVLNSPDNLAQDANGNIFIVEDAPNGSAVGGDIWFARDTNNDGVAESIDHFMSIKTDGSEATGMIFNPSQPSQFVVSVQHPDSTDITLYEDGFGDALWVFDLSGVVAPTAE